MAGGAWRGMARHGLAGRGTAGKAGLGMAGRALAWHGRRGLTKFLLLGVDGMKIEAVAWKQNVPTKGIKPEVAHKSLEAIRKKNGGLTDDAIVDAARPQNHALHKWFEWDDTTAGVEYRRLQSRQLIRSLVVSYAEAPDLKTRMYEVSHKSRPADEQRTLYSTTDDVLSDPESRDRLIASAIKAAMEFRRRFKNLHELDAIIESIDKVIEKLGVGT